MSKIKKQIGVSRREFLAMGGAAGAFSLFGSPLALFTDAFTRGLINSAQAAALNSEEPRNYVGVLFPRAPTRWLWDSFLTPNRAPNSILTAASITKVAALGNIPATADLYFHNPGMGNWIDGDIYDTDNDRVSYKVEPIVLSNGEVVFGPPLWNRDIPTLDLQTGVKGWAPMKTLLNNATIMRGIDMLADQGHSVHKVTRPIPTEASINGLVADATRSLPIGAIGTDRYVGPAFGGYASESGLGITMVDHRQSNPIVSLLSPFVRTAPDSPNNATVISEGTKRAILKPQIDDVLSSLKAYANQSKPGSDILYKNRSQAEELFNRSFGDLSVQYSALYNKYLDLETRSAEPIANMIPSASTIAGYDLANGARGTNLPAQFAIAEFVLKNGLSSSITMSGINVTNLGVRVANLFNDNDEHNQINRQLSVICHTFQFRALAAMIYAFQQALGPTLWNNTILHVSSEFDRVPRSDLFGTEHAPDSNVHSLFSGAFNKFRLVGNVKAQGRPSDLLFNGTFGAAGIVSTAAGSKILNLEHAAATICHLLRVKNPTRATTLVEESPSGMALTVEKPKNV